MTSRSQKKKKKAPQQQNKPKEKPLRLLDELDEKESSIPSSTWSVPESKSRIQRWSEDLLQLPTRLPFTHSTWKGVMDLRQEWMKAGLEAETRRLEVHPWPGSRPRWYFGMFFLSLSISLLSLNVGLTLGIFCLLLGLADTFGVNLSFLKKYLPLKSSELTMAWKESKESKAPIVIVSADFDTPPNNGWEHRADGLRSWPGGFFLNPTRLWLLLLLVGLDSIVWRMVQPTTQSLLALLGCNVLFALMFWKFGGVTSAQPESGEHAAAIVTLQETVERTKGKDWPFHLYFLTTGASQHPEGVDLILEHLKEKGDILAWIDVEELHAGQPLCYLTGEGQLLLQSHSSDLIQQANWASTHVGDIKADTRYGASTAWVAARRGVPALTLTSVRGNTTSDKASVSFEQVDRASGFVTSLLFRLAKELKG